MNDPRFLRWLNKVVGGLDLDLTRDDKWLCMMYPRLSLLKRLMSDDAVILVSIDDNEDAYLKLLLSEVFGAANFVGRIIWKNVTDNNPTQIATEHEYILVYAKDKKRIPAEWKSANLDVKDRLLEMGREFIATYRDNNERQDAYSRWFRANKTYLWPFDDYKFIDDEGIYTGSRSVHNPGKEGYRYDVIHPETGRPCTQPMMGYRFPKVTMDDLLAKDRILFGEDENKIIELKLYVRDYRAKLSSLIELDGRMGTNELKAIFPESKRPFDFPKPTSLLEELLSFAAPKDALFLDSFGGSGTTAHAILKLNTQDKGTRQFIVVELLDYADELTAERIRRVMDGYGNGDKAVPGLGGSFEFYSVGEPIFTDDELLNEAVGVDAIRRYVTFSEGIPDEDRVPHDNPFTPHLLGLNSETAWVFNYEPDQPTSLDLEFLATLKLGDAKPPMAIIYADRCMLSREFMQKQGIIFKKIPRDITRF